MKKMVFVAFGVQIALGALAVQAHGGPYDSPPPARHWGGGYPREEGGGDIRGQLHATEGHIRRELDRGAISRHEARDLFGELHAIRERVERMRYRDGHLSPDERGRIEHDLDRLNRHIDHAAHDADRRYDGGRPYSGRSPY